MQKGEIRSLKWDRVSLQERVIRFKAKDTKSGEPRVIPIGDMLGPIPGKAIHVCTKRPH